MRTGTATVLGVLALVLPLGPLGTGGAAAASRPVPDLRVTTVTGGLAHPWDAQRIPRGWLITERTTRRLLLHADGRTRRVQLPRRGLWAAGETGMMSLAVDPGFARNRRIYLCHGARRGGVPEVQVTRWKLNRRATRAVARKVLVRGIQATSGRHGGCRLLIAKDGSLLVGTGDAGVGRNPQDLTSLNGKVLRLDRRTGKPWPGNPWADAKVRRQRYVWTYGHRNVQGLAQRRDGSIWSVEHGSHRDDEVNRLRGGGNYGWDPVPGYNESVPMTDHGLPGPQIDAAWSSGTPTIATSGAAWVRGRKWGRLRGTLAVASLAGQRLTFMKFDSAGRLKWTRAPRELRRHGRLRSVTRAPNNDLLLTTANGRGDRVLRVRP